MEAKYARDEINSEISMGEVAFLCDERILDKNIMNRIIISTILYLYDNFSFFIFIKLDIFF